ncbi:hypothetical protein RB3298 [Rhodopirellula baltica SH 1]|uniref:Uncharacterized protein n=1 Tax=Rhodopirellula baltica (strain DSM 10527 / NCIMB 13988 / SH1) TaxID=243090 RepID=Q7UUH0_RHOBA|nr:hypothetical protein RB3298 [Rhodopirellula baltica SH 1]
MTPAHVLSQRNLTRDLSIRSADRDRHHPIQLLQTKRFFQ